MTKIIDLRKKPQSEKSGKIIQKIKTLPQKENPTNTAPSKTKEEILTAVWNAPSFYSSPDKKYLYILIVLLAIGGVIIILLGKDILSAIFLILSSLVLFISSKKQPEIQQIVVDQRGVMMGDTAHPYKDLNSFWIHYESGDIKELSLESKKWYVPYIKIPLENINPLLVRSVLIKFLPEREHERSLTDMISRRIGM